MKDKHEKCSVCGKSLVGGACRNCTTAGDGNTVVGADEAVVSGRPGSKNADTATLMEMTGRSYFAVPEPRCSIGRDPTNNIVIEGDSSVSRFHCVITREDGLFHLDDLDSKNGTFLNGYSVFKQTSLSDGDSIRVGRVRFKLMVHAGVTMASKNSSVKSESDK